MSLELERTAADIRVDLGVEASIVLFADQLLLLTTDAKEAWRFAVSLRADLENADAVSVIVSSGPPAAERIRRAMAQQAQACDR